MFRTRIAVIRAECLISLLHPTPNVLNTSDNILIAEFTNRRPLGACIVGSYSHIAGHWGCMPCGLILTHRGPLGGGGMHCGLIFTRRGSLGVRVLWVHIYTSRATGVRVLWAHIHTPGATRVACIAGSYLHIAGHWGCVLWAHIHTLWATEGCIVGSYSHIADHWVHVLWAHIHTSRPTVVRVLWAHTHT